MEDSNENDPYSMGLINALEAKVTASLRLEDHQNVSQASAARIHAEVLKVPKRLEGCLVLLKNEEGNRALCAVQSAEDDAVEM